MKKSFKSFLLFSIIALIGGTIFSGCKKTIATTAKITVRDKNNVLVVDAKVKLYGAPSTVKPGYSTSISNFEAKTDSKGVASFNLDAISKSGQAGVAVLNIYSSAPRILLSADSIRGYGVIKIEAEKENTEKVFIE